MNFSQRQADPRRHLAEPSAVIPIQVLVGCALVTGSACKPVDGVAEVSSAVSFR